MVYLKMIDREVRPSRSDQHTCCSPPTGIRCLLYYFVVRLKCIVLANVRFLTLSTLAYHFTHPLLLRLRCTPDVCHITSYAACLLCHFARVMFVILSIPHDVLCYSYT